MREITKNIDGWLSKREAVLLYNLAKSCKGKGVIVEIGSWKGKSTIYLASGSLQGEKTKVYAIDPHTGSSEHQAKQETVWTFEEFKKNIKVAEVEDIIIPIIGNSEEAARKFNEPIELIFIDGAHEYELVKKDYLIWSPKIIEGGIIAFHDTTGWYGPKKVVKKFIYKSNIFKNIKLTDSIVYAKKGNHNNFSDKIKNKYALILFKLYNFVKRLKVPTPIKVTGKKILNKIQGAGH